MKKPLLLLIMLLCYGSIWAAKPPLAVRIAFNKRFPNADKVKWTRETMTEWEADFLLNNVPGSALFSNRGKWIATETHIDESQLPDKVRASLQKDCAGCQLLEAEQIQALDKGLQYEVLLKSGKKKTELVYSSEGLQLK